MFIIKEKVREVSTKKGVLTNFAKFPGKYQCQSFFFNKVGENSEPLLLGFQSFTVICSVRDKTFHIDNALNVQLQ